jgi:predicted DNA-binding transcriptional regulator YafY
MNNNDSKRISRLTAILTQLQTRRLLTAKQLTDRFGVSVRTIYRDIKALEQAGVPIVTEDGKGYSLMEHYRIPPVMFTESEANALVTAEQLVLKNKDASFVSAYSDAIAKIKAVLKHSIKDKANLLAERVQFRQNASNEKTSSYLSEIQYALTNFKLAEISYTDENNNTTNRRVEPFAVYSTQDNWVLIAYCRLRKDYRAFRLDRIEQLRILDDSFKPHAMTLEEYYDRCRKKYFPDP